MKINGMIHTTGLRAISSQNIICYMLCRKKIGIGHAGKEM
jgi:hypothetical protein